MEVYVECNRDLTVIVLYRTRRDGVRVGWRWAGGGLLYTAEECFFWGTGRSCTVLVVHDKVSNFVLSYTVRNWNFIVEN